VHLQKVFERESMFSPLYIVIVIQHL